MNITVFNNDNPFDSIRHHDEQGNEFWYARELMPLLEYKSWQKFNKVIESAIENLETVTEQVNHHIIPTDKMVKRRENIRDQYFALFDNSPATITIEGIDITCMGSTVLTYVVSGSFCKRLK